MSLAQFADIEDRLGLSNSAPTLDDYTVALNELKAAEKWSEQGGWTITPSSVRENSTQGNVFVVACAGDYPSIQVAHYWKDK